MSQSPLDTLLNKPMGRREFLVHIGLGFLMLTGINGLIKGLNNYKYSHAHTEQHKVVASHGFGASKFGT